MRNGDVVLRKTREEDIANHERWIFGKKLEDLAYWEEEPFGEKEAKEFLTGLKSGKLYKDYCLLEIQTAAGAHIGWVNYHPIEPGDRWMKGFALDKDLLGVGIQIEDAAERGKGHGEAALTLYMAYLFKIRDADALYAQTESVNLPMVRLAEKIGFAEMHRVKDLLKVRGKVFDALTFSISRQEFFNKYADLKEV